MKRALLQSAALALLAIMVSLPIPAKREAAEQVPVERPVLERKPLARPPLEPQAPAPPRQHTADWLEPSADLPHLESTQPGERRRIDRFVERLMTASHKSAMQASNDLVGAGKPAFPRVLGAMAGLRDQDDLSQAQRLALRRADDCLRRMDGWLTGEKKRLLDLDSDDYYIAYICREHYRRWMCTLRHLRSVPGPWDPLSNPWRARFRLRVALKQHTAKQSPLNPLRAAFGCGKWSLSFLFQRSWKRVLAIPAKLAEYRAAPDRELSRLLVRNLNHDDVRLRTLARDCLRVLHNHSAFYNPNAPARRRYEKQRAWARFVGSGPD